MKGVSDKENRCITGDLSIKYICFTILIQYITTTLERILFSSVVQVLAFGARGHRLESCPDLIFLPCIYSFVSLLRTLFVRDGIVFSYDRKR